MVSLGVRKRFLTRGWWAWNVASMVGSGYCPRLLEYKEHLDNTLRNMV